MRWNSPSTRAAAAVLTLFGVGCAGCAVHANAASAYAALPKDVPARFRGEPADDARHCLVHLRQRHLPPGLGAGTDPATARAWIEGVNRHQRELYGILRAFADAGLGSVLAEGVYVEDPWDDPESVEVEYVERLRAIDRALSLADRPHESAYRRLRETPGGVFAAGDEIEHLPTDSLRRAARRLDEVKYAPGAEYLLALEGRLRVLPAERWGLISAATGAYDAAPRGSSHFARADPALFGDREDAALALGVAGGRALTVLLLGGLHDLSDNVARWNAAHPGARIDLVEVTPSSY